MQGPMVQSLFLVKKQERKETIEMVLGLVQPP
jgi:hypothetical protein